ncbi:MAG: hypothetical protein PSV36_08485 [Algoriphagus sp.]|nr:hypothetical protein [Algoriphagus sp.]
MGRIRVTGIKSDNHLAFSKVPSQDLSGKEKVLEDNVPKTLKNNESSLVDFPLIRKKVRPNAKKKGALIKLFHAKTLIKRNRILQLRREKFEKYRIDFMPLCMDEDLEKLAASLKKDFRK